MLKPPAGLGPLEPSSDARWYCLSRDGLATLCADEDDAHEVAAESWVAWPHNGPYRVAQMVDAEQVAAAAAAERERWAGRVQPLTARELELLQGLIDRELRHAEQCDHIQNRTMAERQKGWDMERVALLRKLGGLGA